MRKVSSWSPFLSRWNEVLQVASFVSWCQSAIVLRMLFFYFSNHPEDINR